MDYLELTPVVDYRKIKYHTPHEAIAHMVRVLQPDTEDEEVSHHGGCVRLPDLFPFAASHRDAMVKAIRDLEVIGATKECIVALNLDPVVQAALAHRCIELCTTELAVEISGFDVIKGYFKETQLERINGAQIHAMIETGAADAVYKEASDEWRRDHRALSALYVAGTFSPECNDVLEKFVHTWVYPLEGASDIKQGLLRSIAAQNKAVPCLARLTAVLDSREREGLVSAFTKVGSQLLGGQARILDSVDTVGWYTKWALGLQLFTIATIFGAIAVLIALAFMPEPEQLATALKVSPVGFYIAVTTVMVFAILALVACRCCASRRGQ